MKIPDISALDVAKNAKVAIVGSRGWPSMDFVSQVLEAIGPFTLISGGARGVDAFAESFARIQGWPEPHIYEAEWNKYRNRPGKNPAGVIRNTLIVNDCDVLIAFWDGISPGTKDSIAKAKKRGIPTFVFRCNDGVLELEISPAKKNTS